MAEYLWQLESAARVELIGALWMCHRKEMGICLGEHMSTVWCHGLRSRSVPTELKLSIVQQLVSIGEAGGPLVELLLNVDMNGRTTAQPFTQLVAALVECFKAQPTAVSETASATLHTVLLLSQCYESHSFSQVYHLSSLISQISHLFIFVLSIFD